MGGRHAYVTPAGEYATPTHAAVNVTTTSAVVKAANNDRKYLLLINDSDTVIYLKLGVAAVLNEGIRLNGNGSSYEISESKGDLYTGAIYGIHGGSGNKVLLITEGA